MMVSGGIIICVNAVWLFKRWFCERWCVDAGVVGRPVKKWKPLHGLVDMSF